MRHGFYRILGMIAVIFVTLVNSSLAAESSESSGARWRLELQGMRALTEDHSDRNGSWYYAGSAEYETPVLERCTLGLRLYPLFIYPGHEQTNYGVAAGVAARIYQNKGERDGLYAEAGVSALVTAHKFKNDSSSLNFLNEFGVGYQFPENNWHVALKFEHISNAGLGSDNRGINAVGLGIGYTF